MMIKLKIKLSVTRQKVILLWIAGSFDKHVCEDRANSEWEE